MQVLLTGGAGYIGSHTALVLLEQGHDVVVLDDFSNSSRVVISRLEQITGRRPQLIEADLTDAEQTRSALAGVEFDSVVHFAGLKAVGESVHEPTRYYRVNLLSTLVLLDLIQERQVSNLVFSSSATVYGTPRTALIPESATAGVALTNPYGWSKAFNEQIISDAAQAWPQLRAVHLRYFNPVGAHPSGMIGEDPQGPPNNLLPYVAQVAVGRREKLHVFGDDYPTPDGTGVRDYIHVMDLAEGHVAALERARPGTQTFNLGTGAGVSVLEAIRAFEAASGRSVPFTIAPRRSGDVAAVVADPSLAFEVLGWRARRTFDQACRDAWAWQSANRLGYADSGSA